MDLILWRHADAEDGFPDDKRSLTPKGRKQAAAMAKWLAQRLPSRCDVLASPALRAQQTAGALGKFSITPALGLDTTPEAVLQAARWPHAPHPVVLVGHQPTIGLTAALLLSGQAASWSVRKGAIYWFAYRDSETILRAALAPELL